MRPSYAEFWQFFGEAASIANSELHCQRLRPVLDADTRAYWSKIEQPRESRESRSRGIFAAASLIGVTTEVRDQFWMKRYRLGSVRQRTRRRPAQ